MLACCGANGGLRALCEVTEDGLVRGISEMFEKKPFNAPNDLAIHPDGSVYFSDPRYVGFEPLALAGMQGVLSRALADKQDYAFSGGVTVMKLIGG